MIDITSPRATSRPRTPEELLRLTDRTLGQTIEAVTGIEPALEVQRQWHLSPPHAPWVAPPLSGNGWGLGRGTSYRVAGQDLSRNVSYVISTRIEGSTASDLEDGRINLGEMFRDPKIVKHDFRFGTDEDPEAADFDLVLRSCFPDVSDLHPYVWRRYQASNDRGIAFLVIESLPLAPWEAFLPQRAEATRRPRLSAGDDGANNVDPGRSATTRRSTSSSGTSERVAVPLRTSGPTNGTGVTKRSPPQRMRRARDSSTWGCTPAIASSSPSGIVRNS